MDSPDAPDASEAGVGVRVLLPDGGQMEPPEEEAEGDEAEGESDGDEATEAVEEVDEDEEDASEGDESEDEASSEAESTEDEEDAEAEEGDETEAEEGDESESGPEDEDEAADEGDEAAQDGEEESEREKAEADEGARLLHLNVDGLFLDLLGLEVDLDTVTLDLTAVPGESKLLGNLLSAVSGLLGGDPLSDLVPDNPLSGLFGGGEEGDEEEGDDSGMTPSLPDVSPMERARGLAASIADAIRGAIQEAGSSIIAALPLEELLAEFLQALVDQLLESAGGDGDGDEAEEAAASA